MIKELYVLFPNTKYIYKISSDNTELLKKIELYYGKMSLNNVIIKQNSVLHKIDYMKNILTVNNFNGEMVLMKSQNIDYIMSIILRYIRDSIILDDNYILYHASCVKVGEEVYMLVGSTSSGKTTLTAYLSTLPNASVLSEDITMVNYTNCKVVPLPRPLLLRMDSYELLIKKYNLNFRMTHSITYSGCERIAVVDTTEEASKPFLVDKILFLNLDKNFTVIEKCKNYENLLINSYSNSDTYKNVCASISLTSKVPMYNVHYFDLEEVYENIKNIY